MHYALLYGRARPHHDSEIKYGNITLVPTLERALLEVKTIEDDEYKMSTIKCPKKLVKRAFRICIGFPTYACIVGAAACRLTVVEQTLLPQVVVIRRHEAAESPVLGPLCPSSTEAYLCTCLSLLPDQSSAAIPWLRKGRFVERNPLRYERC